MSEVGQDHFPSILVKSKESSVQDLQDQQNQVHRGCFGVLGCIFCTSLLQAAMSSKAVSYLEALTRGGRRHSERGEVGLLEAVWSLNLPVQVPTQEEVFPEGGVPAQMAATFGPR